MPIRPHRPRPGRPRGSGSFDASVALAFGSVVRETRLASGLSQEDLANLAQLERAHLSRLERGKAQPTLFALLKVSSALGLEGAHLVRLVEDSLSSR
jgi:transcriptional regulator with XRE-family HTH domain